MDYEEFKRRAADVMVIVLLASIIGTIIWTYAIYWLFVGLFS